MDVSERTPASTAAMYLKTIYKYTGNGASQGNYKRNLRKQGSLLCANNAFIASVDLLPLKVMLKRNHNALTLQELHCL